ncbi:YesN/AraC family two-component response regulator [Paenibacillus endophyticus]|uniref:YesN/AraC family two-component response regulator n=1 Tax=Paenibacillus endophyticus TaxID=1294268 RepID=A0A7W5GAK3_9BACL|nr:helix-turn-helix domain-containing protein [Paenibacillus endophyticus]MBB3153309.1 YesN/AraC family two-component response regulator [Paenibacillus endophyticus]
MPIIHMTIPPLPHYIIGGYTLAPAGRKHPSRRNIEVFDLLVVTRGCLYIGEEEQHYEVSGGHALILRPDAYHYATRACQEQTSYYWIHFQTTGQWGLSEEAIAEERVVGTKELIEKAKERVLSSSFYTTQTFTKQLPQFTKLLQPSKMESLLNQLVLLNMNDHIPSVKWKQQLAFQEVIEHLSASMETQGPTPSALCAEQAASYLREHYRDNITAQELGESINFHPVYIARCMQKEFGCAPFDYLMRFRIERAKLLLLQTDLAVARIGEEVGFNHAAYFASCFAKYEGISPRKYRQRFSHG